MKLRYRWLLGRAKAGKGTVVLGTRRNKAGVSGAHLVPGSLLWASDFQVRIDGAWQQSTQGPVKSEDYGKHDVWCEETDTVGIN